MSASTRGDDRPFSSESDTPERPQSKSGTILLDADAAPFPIDTALLMDFAQRLLEAAGESGAELSIALVDDTVIQRLNRDYRGQDRSTDVLSFSLREGEPVGQHYPLGDIVISLETARRQGDNFGNNLMEEICELLFHGFLHLLGHDHEGENRDEWNDAEAHLIAELKRFDSPYYPKGLCPDDILNHFDLGRKI